MAPIPSFYVKFFGFFEPMTTFAGFVYAWFFQQKYYNELIPTAAPTDIGDTSRVLLLQLGNTYLILFLVSAFIWSRTREEHVLRGLTWALYLGDVGHLYTMISVQGLDFFIEYSEWNALAWGNVGITTLLFIVRSAFLLRIGFRPEGMAHGAVRRAKSHAL